MSLSGLLPVINADPELRRALDQAAELPALGGDLIAPASLRPLLVAALAQSPLGQAPLGQPTQPGSPRAAGDGAETGEKLALAVTATAREAEELAAALGSLLGPDCVGYFPAWETLPHERLSPRPDTSGQRLAA